LETLIFLMDARVVGECPITYPTKVVSRACIFRWRGGNPKLHIRDRILMPTQTASRVLITRPTRRAAPTVSRPVSPYGQHIDCGAVGCEIDGRSREGRFIRSYESTLVEHIGGDPSVTQKMIIARATRIALHLELLDERVFKLGHSLTQFDFTHYCAWSNALTRMLSVSGLEGAARKAPQLETYLASAHGGDAE
jgi:hypothetical protein